MQQGVGSNPESSPVNQLNGSSGSAGAHALTSRAVTEDAGAPEAPQAVPKSSQLKKWPLLREGDGGQHVRLGAAAMASPCMAGRCVAALKIANVWFLLYRCMHCRPACTARATTAARTMRCGGSLAWTPRAHSPPSRCKCAIGLKAACVCPCIICVAVHADKMMGRRAMGCLRRAWRTQPPGKPCWVLMLSRQTLKA